MLRFEYREENFYQGIIAIPRINLDLDYKSDYKTDGRSRLLTVRAAEV